MILITNVYAYILYMSDAGLQCNTHNSYWYGVQYQIDRRPMGRGTDQWKWSEQDIYIYIVNIDFFLIIYIYISFDCFSL